MIGLAKFRIGSILLILAATPGGNTLFRIMGLILGTACIWVALGIIDRDGSS